MANPNESGMKSGRQVLTAATEDHPFGLLALKWTGEPPLAVELDDCNDCRLADKHEKADQQRHAVVGPSPDWEKAHADPAQGGGAMYTGRLAKKIARMRMTSATQPTRGSRSQRPGTRA
jgi:hypothetical protein